MPKSTLQVVVVPPHRRVMRYKHDQVGNDLSASLLWCETHHEPVWVYDDESFTCPHTRVTEVESNDHVIVPPPWEVLDV